jgi:hypothetical protein
MAEVSTAQIEAYVASVIDDTATTVAEVSPSAAQAAVEITGLTIHQTADAQVFMNALLTMRRSATTDTLLRILKGYQQQYADTSLSVSQVLQEIIDQNGG